jgi:hypothetical protein
MDLKNRQIWQVGAGDKDRDYVDLCLDWDVIIWGPGDYGPWPECLNDLKDERPGQVPYGKRFCEKMNEGDLVVLKLGISDIYGSSSTVKGLMQGLSS